MTDGDFNGDGNTLRLFSADRQSRPPHRRRPRSAGSDRRLHSDQPDDCDRACEVEALAESRA
ncbi:hypothetical protein [Kitasatospora sp. NPDC094016]|uniref:hypothetical protein n=1 Tax=Kitasatospora sp. NPDC094016 TaxID=3154986 RepID=UPI0033256711